MRRESIARAYLGEGLDELLGADVGEPLEFNVSQLLRQDRGRGTQFRHVDLKHTGKGMVKLPQASLRAHLDALHLTELALRLLHRRDFSLAFPLFFSFFCRLGLACVSTSALLLSRLLLSVCGVRMVF